MTDTDTMPPGSRLREAGHRHVWPVRIYYEDTDAGGIVYYVNYLKFAERARTEMLRMTGHEQFDMLRDEGISFAVRFCQADYLAPAYLDDALEVHSTVNEVQGASMRMSQQIYREDQLLCDLRFRIAVMNRGGRPARMPKGIRNALARHVVPAGPTSTHSPVSAPNASPDQFAAGSP